MQPSSTGLKSGRPVWGDISTISRSIASNYRKLFFFTPRRTSTSLSRRWAIWYRSYSKLKPSPIGKRHWPQRCKTLETGANGLKATLLCKLWFWHWRTLFLGASSQKGSSQNPTKCVMSNPQSYQGCEANWDYHWMNCIIGYGHIRVEVGFPYLTTSRSHCEIGAICGPNILMIGSCTRYLPSVLPFSYHSLTVFFFFDG